MNENDRILLNGVLSKLGEWEDKIQNLYDHVNGLEKLILKHIIEPKPELDPQWTSQRLIALESQVKALEDVARK